MFKYDQKITTTAKNYNLQERDVIFAHLIAAGISRADAYHVIYQRNTKGNQAAADTEAAQFIKDRPGLSVLVHKIKMQKPINTGGTQEEIRKATAAADTERGETEEEAELRTRAGLTKKLRQEISGIHGKDSVQGLIQLAKLEGYDKEDNRTEEEKRKYFLPWREKCRSCRLMQVFRELESQGA